MEVMEKKEMHNFEAIIERTPAEDIVKLIEISAEDDLICDREEVSTQGFLSGEHYYSCFHQGREISSFDIERLPKSIRRGDDLYKCKLNYDTAQFSDLFFFLDGISKDAKISFVKSHPTKECYLQLEGEDETAIEDLYDRLFNEE